MIDRRSAIKAIMAVAGGAMVPASVQAKPSRVGWGNTPVVAALAYQGEIVAYQELPNARVEQTERGVVFHGDSMTFRHFSGRFDEVRVLILFAPDVVLNLKSCDWHPDWHNDASINLEWSDQGVAHLYDIRNA